LPGAEVLGQEPAQQQPIAAASLEQPPQVVPGTCRAPVYPTLLRSAQVEGRVLLEFVVDTAGRVEQASISTITSSHSQFEQAARRALASCRYRPARWNDVAARVTVRMPFTFSLRG
jgi:protein TonB